MVFTMCIKLSAGHAMHIIICPRQICSDEWEFSRIIWNTRSKRRGWMELWVHKHVNIWAIAFAIKSRISIPTNWNGFRNKRLMASRTRAGLEKENKIPRRKFRFGWEIVIFRMNAEQPQNSRKTLMIIIVWVLWVLKCAIFGGITRNLRN